MRLFGKITGRIDANDRAEWLSPPFDRRMAFAGHGRTAAARVRLATAAAGAAIVAGTNRGQVRSAGAALGQATP